MAIEPEINQLESQISKLLSALKNVQEENDSLRTKLTKTVKEKAHLLEKIQCSSTKLKQIKERLKKESIII